MKLWTRLLLLGAAAASTTSTVSCQGGGEARDYPSTTVPVESPGGTGPGVVIGAGGTVGASRPTGTGGAGGSIEGRGGSSAPAGGASGAPSTGGSGGSATPPTAGTGGAGGVTGTGGSVGGRGGGAAPVGGTGGTTSSGGTGGSAPPPTAGRGGAGGVTGAGGSVGGRSGGGGPAGGTGGTTSAGGTGGSAAPPPGTDGGICGACAKWSDPVAHGRLPDILPELSGLAASAKYPGLLYTHNDSGDSARFFAIDENAAVTAEMGLTGATAVDWEDIALGPCPTGSCIYLADTGDGSATRSDYTIYRVAEPAARPANGSVTPVQYESFRFLYPDDGGRHNSEALLVHPKSGRLFVIIKMAGRPSVYEMRQPFVAGSVQTLVSIATLRLPDADSIVTGADFHPCGDRMLVRTTDSLYELSAPGGEVEALFAATPVKVPLATQEPQGEAVTYSPDGRRYFTSSETGDDPQPLNIVSCQSP